MRDIKSCIFIRIITFSEKSASFVFSAEGWSAPFLKKSNYDIVSALRNKILSPFSLTYNIKQILDACTRTKGSKPATASNGRHVYFMASFMVSAALIMKTPALCLITSCRRS